MKKVLELFAGVGSFGNPARSLGFTVYSLDFDDKLKNIDFCVDILNWDYQSLNLSPDIIWASPECKAFSVAADSRHTVLQIAPKKRKAKIVQFNSDYSKKAVLMVDKTLEIIAYYLQLNPNLKWYIENPLSSRMWHLPQLQKGMVSMNDAQLLIPRWVDIDQCQYDRMDKKPTRIATNDQKWTPKARCPGQIICGHKENKGGSNKFSNSGYTKRAAFPEQLSFEILNQFL